MQANAVVPFSLPSTEEKVLHELHNPKVVQSDLALLRVANLLRTEVSSAQQCETQLDFGSLFTHVQTGDFDHTKNLSQVLNCGVCSPLSCVESSVMNYQRAELGHDHSLWQRKWKIYGLDWHISLMREVEFILKTLLGIQVEIQEQSFVPICQSKGVGVTDPRFIRGTPVSV